MIVSSKNIALSAISTVALLLSCDPAIAEETDTTDLAVTSDLLEWNAANFKTTMTELFSCNFQVKELTNEDNYLNDLYMLMGDALDDAAGQMEMEDHTDADTDAATADEDGNQDGDGNQDEDGTEMMEIPEIDIMLGKFTHSYNCDFEVVDDSTAGLQAVSDKFVNEISVDDAVTMMQSVQESHIIELMNQQYSCSLSSADYDNVLDAAMNFNPEGGSGENSTLDEVMDTVNDLVNDTSEKLQDLVDGLGGRNLEDVAMPEIPEIDIEGLTEIMKNIDDPELLEFFANMGEDMDEDELMELVKNSDNPELQEWSEKINTQMGTYFMTKFGEDPTFDALCKASNEEQSDSLGNSSAAMSFLPSFRSFSMILLSVSSLCVFSMF